MGWDVDSEVMDAEFTDADLDRMGKIATGGHHAALVNVENHTTSEGNVAKRLTFEILAGTYTGRKVRTDLFLTESDGAKARQHLFLCRLGAKIKDGRGKYVANPNVAGWEDLVAVRPEVIIDVVYQIIKKTGLPSDFPDVAYMGVYAISDPKWVKVPRAGGALPPVASSAGAPAAGASGPAAKPAADPYAGM